MVTVNSVRCCPDPSVDATVDYGKVAGSAKGFLERTGLIPTLRRPRPRIEPSANRIHTLPLVAPLPLPELQVHLNGLPPPDRGNTTAWHIPSDDGD